MQARDIFWIVFAGVSLFSALLAVYDKAQARRRGWRVPEASLLWAAACGGAPAMFLTMLAIRHKTRHAKFMLGLPALILLQGALLTLALHALRVPFRALLPGTAFLFF